MEHARWRVSPLMVEAIPKLLNDSHITVRQSIIENFKVTSQHSAAVNVGWSEVVTPSVGLAA